MIYLLCKKPSDTSVALVKEMNGIKEGIAARIHSMNARRFDPTAAKLVICWGCSGGFAPTTPFKVLNNYHIHSKFNELTMLQADGVPTPNFSRYEHWTDSLARTEHHSEAKDLLSGLKVGDFYTEFVPTDEEYRVHIVNGHSIRIGKKVPRTENYHLRFKSWYGGWRLAYSMDWRTEELVASLRRLAKSAIAAVGYDFGAVDIGIRHHNKIPFVFEVNSAPGLEGGSLERYARRFVEIHG